MQLQSLQGKTALITGAGKGLGKAMAKALAAEGVNIGIVGRTTSDLEALTNELKTAYPSIQVAFATADISNYTEVQQAVSALSGTLKTIDILINNTGILKVGGLLELPVSEWESVFKINVLGTYYMLHEVLPLITAQGQGDIINVASTAGLKGNARMSAYGASKAAVINLTEALMQEVRKSNIRVTTINPSTIATEMTLEAGFTDGNEEKVLQPDDLAFMVVQQLKLPQRAFIKEFGLWSTNP